ncbi:hypothetical protein [Nonomuraea africana]|uniref:Uncharacterized protein n=1 Tax=Nonomuraea africana TaxID=46171 RepID=A0ABR9KDT2_9ACTN|nr:hypothetical protein [Nonomuraea africana]MBE1559961.1 hypothetical protein [Nonomuraea africana]
MQFVGGRLQLEKLGALEGPPLMKELRSLVDAMMPRLDFPELLLEVFDRTGLPADFTHISGTDARHRRLPYQRHPRALDKTTTCAAISTPTVWLVG